MSKLQDLITRLCPDGVPFKPLGELGEFFGGLTGKSKDDFKDGNAKFITYMNVYSNPSLNLNITDFVKVSPTEKQNQIKKGDILFTGSSETPNECGITSVVTKNVDEPIYLNSFCFGLRLKEKEIFLPDFLKHCMRGFEMRQQISKTASGVTRFNVSKARLAKVLIPVPPLEVQEEIVKILDRFTEYTAELQAELQA
ncbi:MAG: restriction endonuclease subunit S, partial [Muribaculaceae bacterium]|nr:restriction endonuclease subunit S [Muribaculaceae bacterium]